MWLGGGAGHFWIVANGADAPERLIGPAAGAGMNN